MFLTGSCPTMRVFVRTEFLHNLTQVPYRPVEADVVGVKSLHSRALGFHVLLRNGALFWNLPIHALCHQPAAAKKWTLDQLQLWDCFDYSFTVHRFARLEGLGCAVRLKGVKEWQAGGYVWTIDWCQPDPGIMDVGVSEFPAEHKCGHLVALADGNFALLPNNRIRWLDQAFVTDEFPARPTYLTNTITWKCEFHGTSPKSDEFFYGDPHHADRPAAEVPPEPGGPPAGRHPAAPDGPDPGREAPGLPGTHC